MTNANDLIHSFNHIKSAEGNFKGITKLEHFAAMAMQGLLSTVDVKDFESKELCDASVRIAKELITSLNKP